MNKVKTLIVEKEDPQETKEFDESIRKNESNLKDIKILNHNPLHICNFYKCFRKFKTKDNLKDHYKSHMTSKAFLCEFSGCEKIYKSKENLILHIKNIHLKLKPYRCRFCDTFFSHRNGNFNFYNNR